MAFKMKGYPQHSGVGGVQAEKELETEMKSMATDKPKMTKTKTKVEKPTQTYEEWAKTAPGTSKWVSKDEYEDMVKTTESNIENYPGDSSSFKLMKWAHNKKADPGSSFKWVQAAAQLAPIAMEMQKSKEEEE